MANWGVGAQGSNYLQTDPRRLAAIMGAELAQREEEEKLRRERDAYNQRLSMLSPDERRDVGLYGLEYVLSRRAKREESARAEAEERSRFDSALAESGLSPEDRKLAMLARKDPRVAQLVAAERTRKEREAADARERSGDAATVLQGLQGGILAPRVGGLDAARVASDEERTMLQAQADTAAQPVGMPQMQPGMDAIKGYLTGGIAEQQQAPIQRYRIIDPAEEKILRDAGVPMPKGVITAQQYGQARQAQAQREAVAERNRIQQETERKKQEEAELKINANLGYLKSLMGDMEAPEDVKAAVRAGRDPYKAYEEKYGQKFAEEAKERAADKMSAGQMGEELFKIARELAASEEKTDPNDFTKTIMRSKVSGDERKVLESRRDYLKSQVEKRILRLHKKAEGGDESGDDELERLIEILEATS